MTEPCHGPATLYFHGKPPQHLAKPVVHRNGHLEFGVVDVWSGGALHDVEAPHGHVTSLVTSDVLTKKAAFYNVGLRFRDNGPEGKLRENFSEMWHSRSCEPHSQSAHPTGMAC